MKRIPFFVIFLTVFAVSPMAALANGHDCRCGAKSAAPRRETHGGEGRHYTRCDEITSHATKSSLYEYDPCRCRGRQRYEPKPERRDCSAPAPKPGYDPCKAYDPRAKYEREKPRLDNCHDLRMSKRARHYPCGKYAYRECAAANTSLPMIGVRRVSTSSSSVSDTDAPSDTPSDSLDESTASHGSGGEFRYKVSVRRYK